MLTIAESDARFLVVPEDAAEVDGLPADVTVLRQPVENIYLVSTSVMDLLLHLDALDSVAFSGTKAEAGICPRCSRPWKREKSRMQQVQRPGLRADPAAAAALPLRIP